MNGMMGTRSVTRRNVLNEKKGSCVINLGDIIDEKYQELEKYGGGGVVIKHQEGYNGNGEEKKTQIMPLSPPDGNDDNDKGNNNDYEYSNNLGLVAMVVVLKGILHVW